MKKNNKITLVVLLLAAAGFLLQSCGKDSKEPFPPSKVTGTITYNGLPVNLATSNLQLNSGAGNGNNLNTFFIRQTAPQPLSLSDQPIFAAGDGTFTYSAFDGDYTIYPVPYKTPWRNIDPISFSLNGTKNVEIKVTPYHWVSNYKTTFVDSVFTATFKLDRIIDTYTGATGLPVTTGLEFVRAYFNVTSHVDAGAAILTKTIANVAPNVVIVNGDCTVRVDLKYASLTPTERTSMLALKATTGKLWVNIGIKTTGITDPLYQVPVALK